MLNIVTATVSVLLLSLTVLQAIYVFRYQTILTSGLSDESGSDSDEPDNQPSAENVSGTAAIILCLRGTDPTLSDCLTGIVSQNHSDFQLHIVLDDHDDPAVEYVEDFFKDQPAQPVLHFNTSHLKTCTLKCSSLITAIKALPDEVEYIALIDADAVADENWLIDLLGPFEDPKVGASTGNRWFTPRESTIGTVFRKIWNAAAVPQVVLYNIGWGGSLAFRREVLKEADFLSAWQSAFCEDTMVAETLEPLGMTMRRVPSVIMENTESTTLQDAFRWIVRQTLTVRLHHRMWPLVLGHSLLTAIACYITPVLMILAWAMGEYSNAGSLMRFFVLYQLINFGLLAVIDRCNRKLLNHRAGGLPSELDASGLGMTILATILNQFLFPLAVYCAWKTKSVHWRGIEYEITRNGRIEMQEYVPYVQIANAEQASRTESIQ